jgi:hypothetical protein
LQEAAVYKQAFFAMQRENILTSSWYTGLCCMAVTQILTILVLVRRLKIWPPISSGHNFFAGGSVTWQDVRDIEPIETVGHTIKRAHPL